MELNNFNEISISEYNSIKDYKPSYPLLTHYIHSVQYGRNEDDVLNYRVLMKKGETDKAKKIKENTRAVMPSALMKEGKKVSSNIKKLTGFIVIDIDQKVNEELLQRLTNDPYTAIIHRSFGGYGVCIFVKIKTSNDFKETFQALEKYYFEKYDVVIDPSCKNPNRLRYMSFDPHISYNEKSSIFYRSLNKKDKKSIDIIEKPYIFIQDDFTNIIRQIQEQRISLDRGDYFIWRNLGFAISDQFGENGREYFHIISQFSQKYNPQTTDKQYTNCLNAQGAGITIATFYYYCKLENLTIYQTLTKSIISTTHIAKTQGNTDIQSIKKNVQIKTKTELDDSYDEAIKQILQSNKNYLTEANKDEKDIQILANFIRDKYQPIRNTITDEIHFNNNDLSIEDNSINDVYIAARTEIENFKVTQSDVNAVLNSNEIPSHDPISKFFQDNIDIKPKGVIEQYVNCINPDHDDDKKEEGIQSRDFREWAFKKWIVGAIHNWVSPHRESIVCPLTLILVGERQGAGKTSFFRNMLPNELKPYYTENKISTDKDDIRLLTNNLMIIDDEFGSSSKTSIQDYKAISDKNIITQRRPYGKVDKKYKRRAILGGTTNELSILKDPTGNRRILSFDFLELDFKKAMAIDKTALWMEAYHIYKKDPKAWQIYTKKDIEKIDLNSEKFKEHTEIEDFFNDNFAFKQTEQFNTPKVFNLADLMQTCNRELSWKVESKHIKDALKKAGVPYKSHRQIWLGNGKFKKGYLLYLNQPEF